MSAHTPGPWVAAHSFRGVYSQHPAPGPVQICRAPENYEWPEQWRINAALIAAAPDLLYALDCCLFHMEAVAKQQGRDYKNASPGSPIGLARAAIAKADPSTAGPVIASDALVGAYARWVEAGNGNNVQQMFAHALVANAPEWAKQQMAEPQP